MSIPSPTSAIPSGQDEQSMNEDTAPKPVLVGNVPKDLTPPPSPSPSKSTTNTAQPMEIDGETPEVEKKWEWWQGYKKDRRLLGFEPTPGKNLVPAVKKVVRKRKRDDD